MLIKSLVLSLLISSTAMSADVLVSVNWKRQHHGLRPYRHSVYLTRQAERDAQLQANRGGNHYHAINLSVVAKRVGMVHSGVASYRGRDYYGRHVNGCNMMRRDTRYAGAAAAVGRNGRTYYSVVTANKPN